MNKSHKTAKQLKHFKGNNPGFRSHVLEPGVSFSEPPSGRQVFVMKMLTALCLRLLRAACVICGGEAPWAVTASIQQDFIWVF